jgi:hypothetical protein
MEAVRAMVSPTAREMGPGTAEVIVQATVLVTVAAAGFGAVKSTAVPETHWAMVPVAATGR